MDRQHYVRFDVSPGATSICVIDQDGKVVWRGKCATESDGHCHVNFEWRRGARRAIASLITPDAERTSPAARH